MEKAAVIGALVLYLDFINLFLFLLRLMGGRLALAQASASRGRRPCASAGPAQPAAPPSPRSGAARPLA